MSFSLNEIEATAKRATRGAGYPWGLAEEAAKATRWLAAHDLDACAELAGLLTRIDGVPLADLAPEPKGTTWVASGGTMCPLAAGAALSDRAAQLRDTGIRLEQLARPALLMPFAALIAQQIGRPVTLRWEGGSAVTDGVALDLSGTAPDLAAWVEVSPGGQIDAATPIRSRARPAPEAWVTLNRLAHRTYAPATEESRLKGAGAGLSDND
ncbi:DUF3726 domain-containing protein [Ruegeria pomeroyi]|uniref:DUF3726 domain-containing protein n=2 Tax=Ruegeria pomeroyi TaxID=89184 RepID=Q5LNL5_RUEPO|nr:DUF3726 domain-containing protein [Ruegeria pomeroyi]HCE70770.1 DUF3726 domain-containing protein [Ruegeria sp.]AAV96423.1 hypothetical protein SPO3188 [Ruegeria pomeroyi DSS-3]NVK95656.1 DUF3726 domain-containing protein [Ruegeria pomeroyi]NVL01308.1 DUF3726 domain-containing protein [Ruegeria pomeroyi]QWV09970.1 DUF3726 domain-containing protein [Ruegeria pomeroyi]